MTQDPERRLTESIILATSAFAGIGAAFNGAMRAVRPLRLALKPYSRFSPCVGCGNPAKGGHCFKCQQKEAAA